MGRLLGALFIVTAHFSSQLLADPPFRLPEATEVNKIRSAILTTNKGDIYIELFPEDAPWHVANFKYLADKGYYRGLKFHIHYQNYIIQGGAPKGKPNGGPGYTLPAEFNDHEHNTGALGMARAPDDLNPQRRSNGGQFHLLLGDTPRMNGAFTVFGHVRKGMEVLKALRKGDVIKELKVFVKP